MLAGTVDQLKTYMRTIKIFDVDWLESMSVGVFPLDVIDPATMIEELGLFLGEDKGPIKGQIRLMPMERLNAVVVITPQPNYLEKVRDWIERLDREMGQGQGQEQSLFVYYVENIEATELAGILSGNF